MKIASKYWSTAAALAISALISNGAAAQVTNGSLEQSAADAAAASAIQDGPVGEIVVTAQGRTQRLRDVPISATVIGGADLQSGNLRNLSELTSRLPAVQLTPGPASDLLNIRGIGSGLNAGFEQSVATFVDGVYRGRSRSSRSALFDVDRVEVLKGPQTTFFGNNAIAGALSIATRRAQPGGDLEYNGSLLYAPTDGEYALEAGISAPLTPTLGIRVAGKAFGMNGYVENEYLDEDGPHQRDVVGRVSLAWEPSETLRSDLRFDYGRFRDRNSFPNEVVGCPPPDGYPGTRGLCARYIAAAGAGADDDLNDQSQGADSFFNLTYKEAALTNQLQLGTHVLTSITSYYDHRSETLTQLAPLPLAGVGGLSLFPTHSPEQYHSFSQELRIQSPDAQTLTYLAGIYYQTSKLDATQATGYYFSPFGAGAPGFTTADTPIATRYSNIQEDRTVSAFAAATLHATSSLRFNGGLRYSIVHKEAHRQLDLGIGGALPADDFTPLPLAAQALLLPTIGGRRGDFTDTDRTDRKLMPSVSVQYDLDPRVMAYASYTKGFKAGGFALSPGADTFGPESVDAYEVGLKGRLFDRVLSFSIAGFLSNYDNLQESTNVVLPSGSIQTIVGNVAKARSKGIELSLTARASGNLSFNADVGYLDARYLQYPGAPCTVLQTIATSRCTQDLSGARRTYAPEWSGSVGASLILPMGDWQLRADPLLSFSSRYFQQATADRLLEQPSFAKIDLRVGVGPKDGRWEAAVIGKNLTDQTTGSFRNNVPTTPGTIYALPDRPFSLAFQFTIKG